MTTHKQEDGTLPLAQGMARSGMTYDELWIRHVGVGGDASAFELEAYLLGVLRIDPYQHDLIAQALNEHFLDHGQDHPVAYSELADLNPFSGLE